MNRDEIVQHFVSEYRDQIIRKKKKENGDELITKVSSLNNVHSKVDFLIRYENFSLET